MGAEWLEMEKKVIGAKIVYMDDHFVLVDKDGEKLVILPYCGCLSGFWGLEVDSPDSERLPIAVVRKLRELNVI